MPSPAPRPRSPVPPPHSGFYGGSNGIGLGHPLGSGRGRKSGLRSRATQLLALRFGWVVLVVWYEIGEFFRSLSTCKFPDSQLRPRHQIRSRSRSSPPTPPPTHLVVLADPHVPHPTLSYDPDSRPWVNRLRQAMDELFMRKSWNVVMRLGRVDGVFVLGDMLDWGRGVMSSQEYEAYFEQYGSIFQLPPSIPMHYIPGNHDVPLGPNHRVFSTLARERYANHFSPPNAIVEVANHTLILLDAVGLVEEDYRRYAAEMQFGEWDGVAGGVIEFVKNLGDAPPPGPKILLSHIPLARPEKADCGPLRESGRISKGAGPGYQNLLGSETSQFLLDELDPSLVLSGDDHDYCDFTHQPHGIREVTVKSFSSSAGIRRPGFHLLSLIPPDPSTPYENQLTHADRPCFLPDQAGVYWRVYLPIAILTFLFLFGSNFWAAWERWNASGHSIYGDLKARLSPNLPSSETLPPSTGMRRASDRPSPLLLSTRKSSQQLAGVTGVTGTSTSNSRGYLTSSTTPRSSFSRSAPVSPTASPQPSPRLLHRDRETSGRADDEESVVSSYENGGAPPRSASYSHTQFPIDSYTTPAIGSEQEPPAQSSYFLPLPESTGRGSSIGVGLGLSTPSPLSGAFTPSPGAMTSAEIKRSSSGTFSSYPYPAGGAGGGSGARTPVPLSAGLSRVFPSDISAAAKAKDKSVLGYVVDSLPIPGMSSSPNRKVRGGYAGATSRFLRVAMKPRNGLISKSVKEMFAIAWPTALVWLIINGMFFLG